MVILKRFPDSMTANIAKSILSEYGIDAFVADENLANADPPVVFASGGLRLMVADEDRDHAAEILMKSEQGMELPDDFDPGEPVEDLPALREARMAAGMPGLESEPRLPADRRLVGTGRASGAFGAALVWLALGAIAMWIGLKLTQNPLTVEGDVKYDTDGDGRIDLVYFYKSNGDAESKADRNADGDYDLIVVYDVKGATKSHVEDRDFDGRFEAISKFDGAHEVISIDRDDDGRPELVEHFAQGQLERIDWYREGEVWKRSHYGPYQKTREESDRDGDGTFETVIEFGEAEEPR